jgi:hypothetical protein
MKFDTFFHGLLTKRVIRGDHCSKVRGEFLRFFGIFQEI